MSFSRSRSVWWILLSLIAVSGLAVGGAQAQGTQRPRRMIELSETNSAEILTNLNQITTPKEGLRQLEEQLKSLKGVTGTSLEDSYNTPYISPSRSKVPNKTLKELLEKQNSWNLTPEELGTSMNVGEQDPLSPSSDDKKDPKKSSLQQFYDALNHQTTARKGLDRYNNNNNNSANSGKSPEFRDENMSMDDSALPVGIRDKVQKLKELVNEDSSSIFNPTRAHSSFDNFFGLNDSNSSKDPLETKSSMEGFISQFKRALDGPAAGPGLDPALKALVPDSAMGRAGSVPGFDSLPKPALHEFTDSMPGNVNSLLNRGTMSDLNNTVINQWNPMYAAPRVEPPKLITPTAPNMDFPRRRF